MATQRRPIIGGLILIALGVLFLLDNLEIVSFGYVISTYWPVILILIGISILMRSSSAIVTASTVEEVKSETKSAGPPIAGPQDSSSEAFHHSSVFGDVTLNVTSKNFKGGSASTVFGDVDIDLSNVELFPGEHILRLNGVFGGVKLTLRKDVPVTIIGHCVAGDISVMGQRRGGLSQELIYKSEGYDTAEKKLKIYASQVFGQIKVL